MKKVLPDTLERFRLNHPLLQSRPGDRWGAFCVQRHDEVLRIIVNDGQSGGDRSGWEHVSVSLADRTPTWDEMCAVKDLFWDKHETVMQFHPKESKYVNLHPYTLHLWKKVGVDPELPPIDLV